MSSRKNRGRNSLRSRIRANRPEIETLEVRLPPGDTVLGGLLARSLIGPGFSWADELSLTGEGPRIAVAGQHPVERGWAESSDSRIQVVARWPSLDQPGAVPAATTEAQPSSSARTEESFATSWDGELFDALALFSDHVPSKAPRPLADAEGEAGSSRSTPADVGRFQGGSEGESSLEPASVQRSGSDYRSSGFGEPVSQTSGAGLAALAAAAAVPPALDTAAKAPASPSLTPAAEKLPASVSPSLQATPASGGTVVWSSKRDGGATDPRDAGGGDFLETFTVPTENATGVSSRTVLQQGAAYTLVAAGDAKVGTTASIRGDAGYQDFAHPRSYSVDGSTPVGLKISGATVVSSWGAYHPHHIYRAQITGTGQTLRVSYSDQASAYPLHQGSLSVQLFQSGPSQPGPLTLGLTQYGPPPPTNECSDDSNQELIDEDPGADGNNCPADAFSANPVRWSDGNIRSRQGDLRTPGILAGTYDSFRHECVEYCYRAAEIAAARAALRAL